MLTKGCDGIVEAVENVELNHFSIDAQNDKSNQVPVLHVFDDSNVHRQAAKVEQMLTDFSN